MFFQNINAHTGRLSKNSKVLKLSVKAPLENCISISISTHKSLPKILSYRTKSYDRYSLL